MVAEINDNVERTMDYKKMSDRITNCLISLGFSLNCDGFDLIKDATIMIISSNNKNDIKKCPFHCYIPCCCHIL